jgi:hypothetical protein
MLGRIWTAEEPAPMRATRLFSRETFRFHWAECRSWPLKECSPGIVGHFHLLRTPVPSRSRSA